MQRRGGAVGVWEELKLASCSSCMELKHDETECFPEPGFHLPFAFIYAAGSWALYILQRKNRKRHWREQIVSQPLLGFTAF